MKRFDGLTMRNRIRPFVTALSLVLLAGCAIGPPPVRTEVTSFSDWSSLPADRTYAFVRTLEFQNSVEIESFENLVRDELGGKGFTFAQDRTRANLVVTLRPSVSTAAVRVVERWPVAPWFGAYGFYGPQFGWYDSSWAWGGWGGWGGAGYGLGGFYGDLHDDTVHVFQRRLELDIDSGATTGKRYYEGRVENTGQSSVLAPIMPALVRALFTDFPGNNGQTRQVDVPGARP